MAGFVIKLPSSRRCALSAGVGRSPFTGAPDDDVRIGPVFRTPWRSSPGGLDFLPGLAYDLQRVAILSVSRVDGCAGGNMLFKSALALLVAWLIGVLIVGRAGELIQLLLLAGLALFLLAFLRAREAALRRATSDTNHTR